MQVFLEGESPTLTKLVYVQKEKNPKLQIFLSSLFQGKNHEI